MRLLCQRITTRANAEDGEVGKFWQARFKAVRLLDEESLLAWAAYVDLNPIRAAMAETLEESDFTSVQRRLLALQGEASADQFLAPLFLDEAADVLTRLSTKPTTWRELVGDFGCFFIMWPANPRRSMAAAVA